MGAEKARQRLIDTASPLLQEGERVEVASVAIVGSVSTKNQVVSGVATAVLSGGLFTAFSVALKQYVLLTDRRLLFFEMNQLTGRPTQNVLGELPRSVLRASDVHGRLTRVVVLTADGEATNLKLRFPWPARHDAEALAAALAAPARTGGGPAAGA
ncbi:hypothetical protein GCM10011608_17080 [Micromonospora sonchi]|uniref:YokE-like PH domain-containing protein n=1 Tax=Micromonospora sonchi TaxID=1763543 RepID=A0A917TQD9_9ACTN|nr:hypothetical protein [Micromonospora sonchi]GGM33174.1 hypothetical protein GCM10011608_17080 [Micromonospora sonchi]